MKKAVSVLVTLFVALLSFAQPSVGQKAKDISLPDTKGKNINLSSLKGKIVLIDFWASWCGPCRKGIPELKNTYAKYQSKGLEIYGISVDSEGADWKQAIREDHTTWIHVNDAKGDVAALWNVNYIPNVYLLDKEGKIIAINPTHQQLDALLKKLLG
ncbi:MAG TPA: TlpA disulfide reductase family protein [Panacibacter sp.]|nr:TlpA disulfide reductase family protein [Panacibacter sp.]